MSAQTSKAKKSGQDQDRILRPVSDMDKWLVLLRKRAADSQKKPAQLSGELDELRHQQQLESANAVQIPLFKSALTRGEDKRAIPDVFARSSVFSSCSDQSRVIYKNREMISMPGVRIVYTGEQLNQSDLDVWQALTELTDVFHSTNECVTTSYHLLKRIGKLSFGKQDYDWLEESITRLFDSSIKIEISDIGNGIGFTYLGHLVENASKLTKTDANGVQKMCNWRIRMNPELKMLFAPGQYTSIYWSVRKALGKKQLAKWLFDYYSSHRVPYDVYVEYLRDLSGSNDKNLPSFTQKLKKSLTAIQAAREAIGQPCFWELSSGPDGKKVHFSWERKEPSQLLLPNVASEDEDLVTQAQKK